MNTRQRIGKVIKDLGTMRGLSQAQLSIQSGVDQHYIRDIENGLRNPSVEIVECLANFFGFTLSRFFVEVEALEEGFASKISCKVVGGPEKEGFFRYMLGLNLSESTAKKYSETVPNCRSVMAIIKDLSAGKTDNMYRVRNEVLLEKIIAKVADSDFDIIGQRMYSCGLKKYLQYLRQLY